VQQARRLSTAPICRLQQAAMPEAQTSTFGAALQAQQNLNGVQAAAGQAVETLTPRVGSSAWDQAVGQKVVWMVAGAQQSATLTLNPPDLGPLQIVLNVNNSQANATFIAAQPEVRQALEAAMPKLRDMLGEAGIQLGQASVNAGTPERDRSFAGHSSPAARSTDSASDGELAASGAPLPGRVISSGQGLVDTFV
jgi:flagellar hook-length control protein FliK